MKFRLTIILFVFVSGGQLSAQESDFTFQSSELQQMALRYTGNTLNWPLLVSLAEHDIPNNTFTLSSSDFVQLETLASTSAVVTEQETRVKALIKSGATIFAAEKLDVVNSMLTNYVLSIRQGNLDETLQIGQSLPAQVDELEETLNANRLVQVEAQLTKKMGTVHKRYGLLGEWENTIVGDLYKESDGVRTREESYANLAFTDGSAIVVDPLTVAVIRKARIDKLSEASDTEITLEEGGLLAKLSAAAKERSNYILNAGSSQSELKTQNFYAETDNQNTVKLTNYDGEANISANDVTITIRKNEGTIVTEGEPPAPPIQLLPAPGLAWDTRDSIIYRDEIVFAFVAVDGAVNYKLQYSTSPGFDTDITEVELTSTSLAINDLELGTTYIRVQAIDELGLRGPFTDPTRVIKNIDVLPPPLFIDDYGSGIVFTLENSITITGVTEPGTRLMFGDKRVDVRPSGAFTITLDNLESDQAMAVVALDGSGNQTSKELRVVHLKEEEVFDFHITGATGKDPIQVSQPEVRISATAYPGLKILMTNEGIEREISTDSRGRWGVVTGLQTGSLTLSFTNSLTGAVYLTKTFSVQND